MILLANSIQAAGRLGPADSKSGLGAFGRLSACADRSNRAENMSPKGDMRRNALRPEFIRRTRAVNQQYHFIAGRAWWPQTSDLILAQISGHLTKEENGGNLDKKT